MNSEDLIKAKLLDNNSDYMYMENVESYSETNESKHVQEYATSDIRPLKNTSDGRDENVDQCPDILEGKNELKKCCFVELNKGISYFNLFSYYVVQFSYVCAFTFIDACQDYLLEDPNYYDISKDEVGTINGDILLFDTLYLIAFIYIYGAFHDIFGRKIMVVFGFISMGISLALYPLAGKVYPNLIFVRLIFSNGICAVTTQPLLADYVNHKSRGFGGGIAAVVSGMGAIFAALFLLKLQSYMDILEVYWVSAGICFGVAIICAFGVKNVNRRNTDVNICNRL
jgi:hypothetical protein